ncbi:MAG TPA: oxidoreductase [Sphaerochaeta sp.]|nr:oxidoreductase [Sphaerochaeta sp.]
MNVSKLNKYENRLNLNISTNSMNNLIKQLGCHMDIAADASPMCEPLTLSNGRIIPNRYVVQPLEGCDSEEDGSPSQLTLRRYKRFAKGGSGVIWVEAVAVSLQGRGHNHMLYLHEQSLGNFKELVDIVRVNTNEGPHAINPFIVLQLHHSGRYGQTPKIVFHDECLDKTSPNVKNYKELSDYELERIANDFVRTGALAKSAGFDAVDVKCCHGYLLYELLRARTRKGQYGGDYEHRTRLIFSIIDRLLSEVGIACTVRMDAYSGENFPYSWGVDETGELLLDEPIRFAKDLASHGVCMLNISNGNPWTNPYLSRPFNHQGKPPEHPMVSIDRLLHCAAAIQREVPHIPVVASGLSGLRQFGPKIASSLISSDSISFAGFGRQAFAYPDLPKDVFFTGELDAKKTCMVCDGCIRLLETGKPAGCVVHDKEVYRLNDSVQ